ncbi:MAG: HEAT repeat domain-containing protein [Deltaproteobacteria bacterium]|nr:HEAT repeat domain-containing protein [Deltaproteobacteria bacterium]
MFRNIIALLLIVAFALVGPTASAQKRRRKVARVDLARVEVLLKSGNPSEVERGLKTLATSSKARWPEAAQLMIRVLALGLPPRNAARVLYQLRDMKTPAGAATLEAYARHRRARVRAAALFALAELYPRKAKPYVLARLGDRDRGVRASAAKIVANKRISDAAPVLLSLLKRGDEVAAKPLGALANADLARKVAETIGAAPDGLVARTLGAMLMNSDFGPEQVRVQVVKALGELPGSEAVEALTTYVGSLPGKSTRASKTAAEVAIEKRLSGGGQ